MKRATLGVIVVLLVIAWGRTAPHAQSGAGPSLVGTWLLTSEDLLTTMSQPGELHTLGITRRVWQPVPTMMGFPQETRAVMGFWRHEVEGQKRADNGEKLSEVMRDPSVIVYTPAGFVGVHFPTRTRTRFAAGEPTDAEARQDGNYLGYYAALGLYPGGRHQGLIFHNILGGSMTTGTTLRRFFDLEGEVVHLTFPPTLNRQGIRSSTYVNLRRLSDVNDMLGR